MKNPHDIRQMFWGTFTYTWEGLVGSGRSELVAMERDSDARFNGYSAAKNLLPVL